MIRIVKEGMCKDCTYAELELYSRYSDIITIWEVRCVHAQACARVETMMAPKETT